jgi:DNA-binding NtrC family response regulator
VTEVRMLVLDDHLAAVTADIRSALLLFSTKIELKQLVNGQPRAVDFVLGGEPVRLTIDPIEGKDVAFVARKLEREAAKQRYELVLVDEDWDDNQIAGSSVLLPAVVNYVKGPNSTAPIVALFTRLWQSGQDTPRLYVQRITDITKDREPSDLVFDGLQKADHARLNLLIRLAVQRRRLVDQINRSTSLEVQVARKHFEEVAETSPLMREVWGLIRKAAATDFPVLILGESGTGKELVAESIRMLSRRAAKPYLPINCSTGEQLIESEIFGHEIGAFTSAVARRIGKYEACDGGTLFLDELAELKLDVQAKLLRLIEHGEFSRMGSNELRRANVRIIAATKQPLEQMVRDKTFREDLYERFRVMVIEIPPLRSRPEDIPALARYFLANAARECGKVMNDLSGEVMRALVAYSWPRNVRQLRNTMIRMVGFSDSATLSVADLPAEIRTPAAAATPVANTASNWGPDHIELPALQTIVNAIAKTRGVVIGHHLENIGIMVDRGIIKDPRYTKATLAVFYNAMSSQRALYNSLFGLTGSKPEGNLRQYLYDRSQSDPALYPPPAGRKGYTVTELKAYGVDLAAAGIVVPLIEA